MTRTGLLVVDVVGACLVVVGALLVLHAAYSPESTERALLRIAGAVLCMAAVALAIAAVVRGGLL